MKDDSCKTKDIIVDGKIEKIIVEIPLEKNDLDENLDKTIDLEEVVGEIDAGETK